MSEPLRRLDLRFDVPEPEWPDYPVVTILVDGEDLLGGATDTGFVGFDPADILGPLAPLMPTEPPRRVAVYRCSCGVAGCGVAAPVIAEHEGRIVWTDFRDFTGVFVRPTVETVPEGSGTRLQIPELAFDAAQYRAEVARASAEDSWETPARKTARLLKQRLVDEDAVFADLGLRRGWVAPDWERSDAFNVSFDDGDGQTVVLLTPAPGSPEDRAFEMAETLLRTPPNEWRVSARNLWPHRKPDHEPT